MIDLHIHTNYSDGSDTLIELLEKAEKLKLDYISITDHDTCKAYEEMKNIDVKKYFSGKIIPGIEIKCSYNKRLIEVLGYNIDTEKMQMWANEYYKNNSKEKLQQKYFDILYEKCKEVNLVMPDKKDIDFDPKKDWASVKIYYTIKESEENRKKLPADLFEEFIIFSKKYCSNLSSVFYIDKSEDYPTLEEVINIIKQCNGLVFLPHLFIYKWADDKKQLINDLLDNYEIDGIECMHSEFSEEESKHLLKLCNSRNYLYSGGSDYHGINKKGIGLAVGKGNLKIEKDLIQNWAK